MRNQEIFFGFILIVASISNADAVPISMIEGSSGDRDLVGSSDIADEIDGKPLTKEEGAAKIKSLEDQEQKLNAELENQKTALEREHEDLEKAEQDLRERRKSVEDRSHWIDRAKAALVRLRNKKEAIRLRLELKKMDPFLQAAADRKSAIAKQREEVLNREQRLDENRTKLDLARSALLEKLRELEGGSIPVAEHITAKPATATDTSTNVDVPATTTTTTTTTMKEDVPTSAPSSPPPAHTNAEEEDSTQSLQDESSHVQRLNPTTENPLTTFSATDEKTKDGTPASSIPPISSLRSRKDTSAIDSNIMSEVESNRRNIIDAGAPKDLNSEVTGRSNDAIELSSPPPLNGNATSLRGETAAAGSAEKIRSTPLTSLGSNTIGKGAASPL